MPEELIRQLRHGYYACVSYMDAQVGKLLDALEQHGLDDNTIVLLWGDHGYHLGEKALWGKTTNYDLDTRAPLIMSVPGAPSGSCLALVEFVDIYPTLIDACGLPLREDLEGTSMMPLLQDPQQPWKSAAFSQFPRPWTYHGEPEVMGYSMRTDQFRYTEWVDFRTGECLDRELYDHHSSGAEIYNVAGEETYASAVAELAGQLRSGWRAARPDPVRDRSAPSMSASQ